MKRIMVSLGLIALLYCNMNLYAQSKDGNSGETWGWNLYGTVTDLATGQPLAGAKVVVDGTNNSTTTDASGIYRLHNVPAKPSYYPDYKGVDTSITVSKIGYFSYSEKVRAYAGAVEPVSTINFTMTLLKDVVSTQDYEGIDANKLVWKNGIYYEADKPYSGKAFRAYQDGKIRFKGSYKDGTLTGKVSRWYQNGQKEFEAVYKHGKLDGLSTTWSPNGQESSEIIWKYGKQWDGKDIRWYPNGQKEVEGLYKDGKFLGETFWDEDGYELVL